MERYFVNALGDKIVLAESRLVEPRGYERSMGIIVDACPYCGKKHRHGFSEETRHGVYGMREADCFKGQYLLVDSEVIDSIANG